MDTNVLFSALYSANGASRLVLDCLLDGRVRTVLSTPLLFEYEDVLKRNQDILNLTDQDIEVVLDNICALSEFQKIYFLWRPYLPDPKDDLVLELAVASGVDKIVTHNIRDFQGSQRFGVEALTPKSFLEKIQ
jgi:putative PIN family toxin of toxin-antitoxin system